MPAGRMRCDVSPFPYPLDEIGPAQAASQRFRIGHLPPPWSGGLGTSVPVEVRFKSRGGDDGSGTSEHHRGGGGDETPEFCPPLLREGRAHQAESPRRGPPP